MSEPRALPCIELPTRRATRRLGRALASALQPGDALILRGTLGAGKTFLVRALCRALGLPSDVRVLSPTFTLLRELPTAPPIAHADLYRLESLEDAERLGLAELRDRGSVLLVEWGERFPEALGPDVLELTLGVAPRRATLRASGPRSAELAEAVLREARRLLENGARLGRPRARRGC